MGSKPIRVALAVLAVLVVMTGLGAARGTAFKPALADTLCSRSGCDVKLPYSSQLADVPTTDCGLHGVINAERDVYVTDDGDSVTLTLKYSTVCISNWTEYSTPSPHQGFIYIHSKSPAANDNVQAIGGQTPGWYYTTMVDGSYLAQGCSGVDVAVRCTFWH
jgi:hypothetical protein